MLKRSIAERLLPVVLVVCASCTPTGPLMGESGSVAIRNHGLSMWVGIDDAGVAAEAKSLVGTGEVRWIGGEVVPDPEQKHGFYFDPATIMIAEITIEAIQTTIEQIAENPQYFADGGVGGNLFTWVVGGTVIQFAESP